jgi:hypothetical protein
MTGNRAFSGPVALDLTLAAELNNGFARSFGCVLRVDKRIPKDAIQVR